MERPHAPHPRLELRCLNLLNPRQIVHAVGPGLCQVLLEDRDLGVGGGDDQLADPAVANALLFAVAVEHLPASDTEPGLQGTGRVVDARVDDFRVAAAGFGADGAGGLDHHHLKAPICERATHRQADHASADDNAIYSAGVAFHCRSTS